MTFLHSCHKLLRLMLVGTGLAKPDAEEPQAFQRQTVVIAKSRLSGHFLPWTTG